jgi:RNA polymerase sigma-70 factor (ECF subfamily)
MPPPEALFEQLMAQHRAELARFISGYERDPARLQELQQELLLALWQSLAGFNGQCSLRTWAYRVAHNVGASHVQKHVRRRDGHGLTLEEAEHLPDEAADMQHTERRIDLARILGLIHRLQPLDRQLMLLYLEDMDAAGMADITGLSARNVATKIHRIKAVLARQLQAGSTRP